MASTLAVTVLALPGAGADSAHARSSAAAMIAGLNAERAAAGVRALGFSSTLSRVSRRHALRIVRTDRVRHSRLTRGGEVLAWHTGRRPLVRRTLRAWLASPAHRAVLLDGRYRRIGARRAVGRIGGRTVTVWVVRVAR